MEGNTKRLASLTERTNKEIRKLINDNLLVSKGYFRREFKQNYYGKPYYDYLYDLEREKDILEILGLEAKYTKVLKEGFN